MARRQHVSWSPEFLALEDERVKFNETNDCGTKCIALVSGLPYRTVHEKLDSLGRKRRGPTPWEMFWGCLKEFGVEWTDHLKTVSDRIPARGDGSRRSLTSYSNRRFPWIFLPDETMILATNSHVIAVVDGQVHDWSINKSLRINRAVLITKRAE